MNEHEARLAIVQQISDVLFDLADDGTEEFDVADMVEVMMDAANLLLESLQAEVVGVDDDGVLLRVKLLPTE